MTKDQGSGRGPRRGGVKRLYIPTEILEGESAAQWRARVDGAIRSAIPGLAPRRPGIGDCRTCRRPAAESDDRDGVNGGFEDGAGI